MNNPAKEKSRNTIDKQSEDHTQIPMVSVIIPNRNGEDVLLLCLESLLEQKYRNFEVIVIDNNSIDNSVEVIQSFKRKSDINIRLLILNRNIGYSGAITLAAKYAKGKYILATNNDVIFDKYYLERLVNTLECIRRRDPKIVAASGLHYYYPERDIINYAGGGLTLLSGYYMYYQKVEKQLSKNDLKYLKIIRYIAFPTGAAALIDRNVFLKLGGYYPHYFAGIEEFDFGIILYKFGYRAIYIPNAILYHAESVSFDRKRGVLVPHKLFLILRNLLIMYLRLYDAPYLILSIFMHIGVSIALLFYSIAKNKKEVIYSVIKAYKFFLKHDLGHAKKTRAFYVNNNVNNALPLHKVLSFLKKFGAYLPLRKAIRKYIYIMLH